MKHRKLGTLCNSKKIYLEAHGSLNLLYLLECEHKHRQMSRYQRLNKLIQTSRKTEKTKNSQSFQTINVNPTMKTIQKLTFKDPREAKDNIRTKFNGWLRHLWMLRICESFCFAYVTKDCPKDISRTVMNKVLHKKRDIENTRIHSYLIDPSQHAIGFLWVKLSFMLLRSINICIRRSR